MKAILLSLTAILFLFESQLYAQSYHPFPDDKIRVYELEYHNQPWESFAIQVSSRDTSQNREIINFAGQVINDYNYTPPCLITDVGSWFAKFVRIGLPSGSLGIINEQIYGFSAPIADTAGASFIANFLPEGGYILATVLDERLEMVLGNEEMVKEIGFEVFNPGGQSTRPDHYLHDKSLTVGAESGLIESFTFNIPDEENPLQGVFRLSQIGNELADIRPGMLDLFPFEVGDSLHVLETLETVTDNRTNKYRYEILERAYDATTGRLEFQVRKEYSYFSNQMGDVNMNSGDTIVNWLVEPHNYLNVVLPPSYSDLLPGQQDLFENEGLQELKYYHLRTGNTLYPTDERREIHFFHEHLAEFPNCTYYAGPLDLPTYYSDYFIEGLGGPYYYRNEVLRRPVFASTAEGRWGEPLDFVVSVDELPDDEHSVKVFPNPILLGDEIFIDFRSAEVIAVDLIDLSGKTVMSKSTHAQTELRIDSSPLVAGVYLIKTTLSSGHSSHQLLKLVN